MTQELEDICCEILKIRKNTTKLVMQKLLYCIQASSLVYLGKPAFEDEIQAWLYGPVVPNAYYRHNHLMINYKNRITKISDEMKNLINIVIKGLANKTAYDLVNMTSSYKSWEDAFKREGSITITKDEIAKCHNEIAEKQDGFIF